MEPSYFFGQNIVTLEARTKRSKAFLRKSVKRVFDMFVSGIALLFLLPLFIAVATAIKIEGQGGSIFYGGKRVGKKWQRV